MYMCLYIFELSLVSHIMACMLIMSILIIVGAALLLCCYVGWGATMLALPQALRSYATLCVPLIGYALTIWVGYLGVSSILNLRWSLALLLLLASILNVLALRHGARPRRGRWFPDYAQLMLVLTIALLAALAPLLSYGYLTSIGRGWDTESYWPMAQYLVDYPLAQIGSAPMAPLRDLVHKPPEIGLTLGFSVMQGFMMLLSAKSAIDTFAPLLAFMYCLGVLSVYVWLRASMGLGRTAALLAAALTALGSLMLWVVFFNFGMQLSSWPLIGLGLCLGLASVEELALRGRRAWPTAILGAAALAALPVAYYPALTVFVPMAAGLGLAYFWGVVHDEPFDEHDSLTAASSAPASKQTMDRSSHQLEPHAETQTAKLKIAYRRQIVHLNIFTIQHVTLSVLVLLLLTLLFAAPTIIDYFEGFSFRYSLVEPKIGPDRFIPPTDTLGLTTFRLPREGAQPPMVLVLASSLACVVLALGLMYARPYRLRWVLVLLPLLAYLVWLRYVRPYEYAYMKSSAFAGAVLWGALMLGWQALWRRSQGIIRGLLLVLVLLPIMSSGWAQLINVTEHSHSPSLFGPDLVAFQQPAAQLPYAAPVLISSDERLVGPNNGLLATALYGRPIWGRVATAYAQQSYWPAGATPGFAVLSAHEPAWPFELGAEEVWRSQALALFRFEAQRALLLGRAELYQTERLSNPKSPAAQALWRRAGPLRSSKAGQPLIIFADVQLRFAENPGQPAASPAMRHLQLRMASLEAQQARLWVGNIAHELTLTPGVSMVSLEIATPTELRLESDSLLSLVDASLSQTRQSTEQLELRTSIDALAWTTRAERHGDEVQVSMQLANPQQHRLRAELAIVSDSFEQPQRLARLLAALPANGNLELNMALLRGTAEARLDGQPVPLLQSQHMSQIEDGSYFAILTLYNAEQVLARQPLFLFRVERSQLAAFEAVPFTVESASVAMHPQADQQLFLQSAQQFDNERASLEQATLMRSMPWPGASVDAPFAPGDNLQVELSWHALRNDTQPLMVSLQILGSDERKIAQWDGPLGGEWLPAQAWAADDRIAQDIPLRLAADTPAGTYRVLLVVYDPTTGVALSIAGQQALRLGEISVR